MPSESPTPTPIQSPGLEVDPADAASSSAVDDIQPNATTPSDLEPSADPGSSDTIDVEGDDSQDEDEDDSQDEDGDDSQDEDGDDSQDEDGDDSQDEDGIGGNGSEGLPIDADAGLSTSNADDSSSDGQGQPQGHDAAAPEPNEPSEDDQDDEQDDAMDPDDDEQGDSDEGSSPSCGPGTYLFDGPSGPQCRACEVGTFTEENNSSECTPWRDCKAPTEYQVRTPTTERDRACQPCAGSSATSEDNQTQCLELAFQMQDERVVFEAEHYDVADRRSADASWTEIEDDALSNDRGMSIGPEAGEYWTDDPLNESPHLDYRVRFTRSGTFYVFIRGDAGTDPRGSDSCYAGIDEAATTSYTFASTSGVWGWRGQALEVETAGVHTVSIYAREDGFRVDKVVIQSGDSAPSEAGPSESPRE